MRKQKDCLEEFQCIIINQNQTKPLLNDKRKHVKQPFQKYPYKYVGKLLVYFTQNQDNQNPQQGTAFFVGEGLLLTVAHNLCNTNNYLNKMNNIKCDSELQTPKNIYFYPSAPKGKKQVRLKIKSYKKHHKYQNNFKQQYGPNIYDFALLQLDQDQIKKYNQCIPKGNLQITYDIQVEKKKKISILATGFPGQINVHPDSFCLYQQVESSYQQDFNFIYYKHLTTGGQSGMCLFQITEQNSYKLIGMHKARMQLKQKDQNNKYENKIKQFGLTFNQLVKQQIAILAEELGVQSKLKQNYQISKKKLLKNKNNINKYKNIGYNSELVNTLIDKNLLEQAQKLADRAVHSYKHNQRQLTLKKNKPINYTNTNSYQFKKRQKDAESYEKRDQGLPNIGNTCFLNSAIQFFYSSVIFRTQLLKKQSKNNSLDQNIIDIFRSIKLNQSYSQKVKIMNEITKKLIQLNVDYKKSSQQDCFQFLFLILDYLSGSYPDLLKIFKLYYRSICKYCKNQVKNKQYIIYRYNVCNSCKKGEMEFKFISIPECIIVQGNQNNKKNLQFFTSNQQFPQKLKYRLIAKVIYSGIGRFGHYQLSRIIQDHKQQFYRINDSHIIQQKNNNYFYQKCLFLLYQIVKQPKKQQKHQLEKIKIDHEKTIIFNTREVNNNNNLRNNHHMKNDTIQNQSQSIINNIIKQINPQVIVQFVRIIARSSYFIQKNSKIPENNYNLKLLTIIRKIIILNKTSYYKQTDQIFTILIKKQKQDNQFKRYVKQQYERFNKFNKQMQNNSKLILILLIKALILENSQLNLFQFNFQYTCDHRYMHSRQNMLFVPQVGQSCCYKPIEIRNLKFKKQPKILIYFHNSSLNIQDNIFPSDQKKQKVGFKLLNKIKIKQDKLILIYEKYQFIQLVILKTCISQKIQISSQWTFEKVGLKLKSLVNNFNQQSINIYFQNQNGAYKLISTYKQFKSIKLKQLFNTYSCRSIKYNIFSPYFLYIN